MHYRIISRLAIAGALVAFCSFFVPAGGAQTPAASATPSNAITTYANGICITFVPGSKPVLTASTIGTDSSPAVAIAVSKNIQYVDKHGRNVNPSTINLGDSLQPIWDLGASGPIILRVMVDRN